MYQNVSIQSELSTELYEAKNLIFNLDNRTLGNSNLNIYFDNTLHAVLRYHVEHIVSLKIHRKVIQFIVTLCCIYKWIIYI